MAGQGAGFYGFTNAIAPTSDTDIGHYLDYYSLNAGTGSVPAIITQTIPQSSGGNDSEGNAIVQYNFVTTEVSGGTVTGNAWYTWVIPDEGIGGGGNRQVSIDYSDGNGPNTFVTGVMAASVYTYSVNNPGGSFAPGTYRLYTTFSDEGVRLDNTTNTLYFKGNTVS